MNGRRGNRTRARDADRSAACELIDTAYADGQLSLEEHDLRVSKALQARTVGELRGLTGDLQGEQPAAPPVAVARKKPAGVPWRQIRLPRVRLQGWQVAVLLTAAGLALVPLMFVLTREGELLSVEGLEALVEDARDDLGSTRVDAVIVFEHHASLTRAQAGSPNRDETLTYRRRLIGGGFNEFTRGTRDQGETFVDLAEVDVSAAIDLLERAPKLVRVSDSSPEAQTLRIESTGGGRLHISVSNEFSEHGWVIASLDGEIREIHPHDE